MTETFVSPAIQAFAQEIERAGEMVFCQVIISKTVNPSLFILRHSNNRNNAEASLNIVPIPELRKLVQFDAKGRFRPLKSAPDLQEGWAFRTGSLLELERALQIVYPGALADWFRLRREEVRPTSYREFTARQTGMYRITTFLEEQSAAQAIAACCHERFCWKRRLWTAGDSPIDPPERKSLIPCLEPCAVMLEFARKAVRIGQAPTAPLALTGEDYQTVEAALNFIASHDVQPELRAADFGSATHPRRVQLLLEKLKSQPRPAGVSEEKE
jgi:hypothetical protein